jgi:flagellar biosynthesis protein FlhF
MSDTKTYFGASLDEVLPQIRDELGSDAVIVRQREGIVGGIGGFFGKKCVEIEARPAVPAQRPSMPASAVIDAYDTGGQNGNLIETLLAQASPFAERLDAALAEAEEVHAEPEPDPEPEPEPEQAAAVEEREQPAPPPPPVLAQPIVVRAPGPLPTLRSELVAAAIPPQLADSILAEAEQRLRPFDTTAPARQLARRVLERRIPIAPGWNTRRRTIAVVGLEGSGRTLAAASLATAYARAGRSVAVLSLESGRGAMQLADLTAADGVRFEVAPQPSLVTRARTAVQDAEIVVADTPPLTDAVDGRRLRATLKLLGALEPDETHLVLPAGISRDDGARLIDSLASTKLPNRLIVSHADDQRPTGVPVGLALGRRIPISFVGTGGRAGMLRPPSPDTLARMVLR